MLTLIRNEKGGTHILILGLFAVGFILVTSIVGISILLHSLRMNDIKSTLDEATYAATMNYDKVEASYGRIAWDKVSGTSDFFKYFRKGFHLDETISDPAFDSLTFPYVLSMGDMTNRKSYLKQSPILWDLELVTAPTYPFVFTKTLTISSPSARNGGTLTTTRNINIKVSGPSIVSILEIQDKKTGDGTNYEPTIETSASELRFFK